MNDPFLCIIECSLLIFCRRFLHLCSPGLLACGLTFCGVLSGFKIRVMLASQNVFGSFTFSSIFVEFFQENKFSFFFKYLVELTCESLWYWTFVLWQFLMTSLIFFYQILVYFCLEGYVFLVIYSFLLGCSVCWYIIFCTILLQSFLFLCYDP